MNSKRQLAIAKALRAVNELIPLFPFQSLADPELKLVTKAAVHLQALQDRCAKPKPRHAS